MFADPYASNITDNESLEHDGRKFCAMMALIE